MNPALLEKLGIESFGTVLVVPKKLICPFPGQPRKYFDQTELGNLARSIKRHGQKVPALVRELDEKENGSHKYQIVDGQRRWHALDIADVPKMKVVVVPVENAAEQFLVSVVANFGGARHSTPEIVNAILRFQNEARMSRDEIAEVFSMSRGWVDQHFKLADKLRPDVLDMMSPTVPEEDRLPFTSALLVADVPTALQVQVAETIVSKKLKLVQVRDYIQRQGKRHGFIVGNPDKTPRKDYEIVFNFLKKMKRELGVYIHQPQAFFTKMFEFREDDGDHRQMVKDIDRNVEDLKTLATLIRRAKDKPVK